MVQSMAFYPPEPSWLRKSEVEVLEVQVDDISTKLGILHHEYPGLEFVSELLESANTLISYVYDLHTPAAMREIYTSQNSEYFSQEAYSEEQIRLSYVTTNLGTLTSIYDDTMRQLHDPDLDGVHLRVRLINQSRSMVTDKLRTELTLMKQELTEQELKIKNGDEKIAHLSVQLDEARCRIETQSKGSTEERKYFAEFKKTTSEVSSENMNLRLERDILNCRNRKLQEAADAELEYKKELYAKLEGTQKDLQVYMERAEEAERAVKDKDNKIQLIASMWTKSRERLEALQKSIESLQAEARSREVNELQQQLQETRRELSTAKSDISSLQLEKERTDDIISVFASQLGLVRLPTSPINTTQILPRVRPRIGSFSEINTNHGDVSPVFQALAQPRAIMDPIFENDLNNNNTRPRNRSTVQISSEIEDMSMWGTGDFQNSAIASAPDHQGSQSLSISRRDSGWIRPDAPLHQVSDGNRTPEGCYRVNAHFKRYPQRRG